jgi:hypothetical protein
MILYGIRNLDYAIGPFVFEGVGPTTCNLLPEAQSQVRFHIRVLTHHFYVYCTHYLHVCCTVVNVSVMCFVVGNIKFAQLSIHFDYPKLKVQWK